LYKADIKLFLLKVYLVQRPFVVDINCSAINKKINTTLFLQGALHTNWKATFVMLVLIF